jgi:hypothetical protein
MNPMEFFDIYDVVDQVTETDEVRVVGNQSPMLLKRWRPYQLQQSVSDITGDIAEHTEDTSIHHIAWETYYPTLDNNWSDYDPEIYGYVTACKIAGASCVTLRGMVKDGTSLTVLTMPSGWIPLSAQGFIVPSGAANTPTFIRINRYGVLQMVGTIPSYVWLCLTYFLF